MRNGIFGARASRPHEGKLQDRRARRPRSGMTLVELMVVSSIVLLLVVISVPVVRPMLMSRKQADAAQILSIYLNSARNRAYETGRDCGVMFERYTDNNTNGGMICPNNDSCLVIRQVEVPPPYVGMNSDVRVAVELTGSETANIIFCRWNSTTNSWDHPSQAEDAYWNNMVSQGDKIQFDNQGPFYTIIQPVSGTGQYPQIAVGGALRLAGEPEDFNVIRPIPVNSPVMYKLLRQPKSGIPQLTLVPPVGFPAGIIVDLQYSGIGFSQSWTPPAGDDPGRWGDIESDFKPRGASDNDPVIVMFSPSGAVSLIRSGNTISPSGPIHFLVGRWDRAASDWRDLGAAGNPNWYRPDASPYPPEDELRNFQDLSNFWVTIDPNTGRVRTNPVAPSDIHDQAKYPLVESRRYANKSQ